MLAQGEIITGVQVLRGRFAKAGLQSNAGSVHHALNFRLEGSLRIFQQGREMHSYPGTIVFLPAGVPYQSIVDYPGERISVYLTTTGAEQPPDRIEVLQSEHVSAMHHHFSMLQERYRVGREQDYDCLALAYQLLSAIEYEQTREQREAIPERMLIARERIERNYGDANLSISQLAAEAGVSEAYFRREFRRHFDMSPIAMLKKTRIENARLMLGTSYVAINEVARQCGFESLSYFSYEFHRLTGQTPTEAMAEAHK